MVDNRCKVCGKDAVIKTYEGFLCSDHFVSYFEDKVFDTIERYSLVSDNERVGVAVSGGKDSVTALYLVSQFVKKKGYNCSVKGILIDEGISGYRKGTIDDLERFCNRYDLNFEIFSFKDYIGMELDDIVKKIKTTPCSACGVFRRYLINLASRNFDVVVTGHNLDDEAQSILMNVMKNNSSLLSRIGIKNGIVSDDKLTRRVKPLYFCREKEVLTYSIIKGFSLGFRTCPYASFAFRSSISSFVNSIEEKYPGTKLNIAEHFLLDSDRIRQLSSDFVLKHCEICGEPSSAKVCKACQMRISLGLIDKK